MSLQRAPLEPEAPLAAHSEIVVSARRPRGSVVGTIPPERTYSALDIRAYGADDIGTLIQSVGPQSVDPQTGSARDRRVGRPVVLLNGKRVSSFSEISRIPTEAIERMEIFPEEVALKYGLRPDQKIVNIVTFETFTSRVVQTNLAVPTDGGADRVGASGTLFSIRRSVRISVTTESSRRQALLERQRGIRGPAAIDDPGGLRTLLPSNDNLSLNGTISGPIRNDVEASINVRLERDTSRNLLGSVQGGLLSRDVRTDTIHLGAVLNGRSGEWLWSAIGNYDRTMIGIASEVADAAQSPDDATSSNALATIDVTANGPVLDLPAGPVTVSLGAGLGARNFVGRSWGGGPSAQTSLSRDRGAMQASLDVPISNPQKGASPLGRLTANANAAVERLSDFGTLNTYGYGLYWTPVKQINVYGSVAHQEDAPTVEQLGAPRIETPNVRTYDFVSGGTIDIIRIAGGTAALLPERRRTVSLGMYAKPLGGTDLTISLDYTHAHVDDPIVSFPIATAAIERAFPDRFTRDAGGRLMRIDGRPLNFNQSERKRLRSGITFTKPLGKGPPLPKGTSVVDTRFYPNEAAMRAATPPGMVIVEVAPGSADADRIEALASRLTLALYHTMNLVDKFTVRNGGPVLDLLDGSAADMRGGTPRHVVEAQAGIFKGGLGARISTEWRSATTIRDSPGDNDGAGDLRFSSYATANISLFVTPAQRIGGNAAPKWLRGVRVTMNVTNIFNARPKVADRLGRTPFNYQPSYLEPFGRVASLSFRKMF